jgi:hypothetical protein
LIQVSVRDVLAPEQAKQTIEQRGIDDLGLNIQWKLNFPIHIVHRFQEIQSDEVGARDNFSDRALGLLRLLEQTLEFFGDYFGQKEFGTDWQDRFSTEGHDKLTFDNLRNFLNTEAVEDCLWVESVQDLMDEPIIGGDDIIDARNMLSHDRLSYLDKDNYNVVKDRVETIFGRMASEVPIIGEIESEHDLGAYVFRPYWENVQKWSYLRSERDLYANTFYYLPPDSITDASVIQLDRSGIIECNSDRVIDNISQYS